MNEQIRELAKQAGGHKCLCVDAMSISLLGENSIEKFAELIVQECAEQVEQAKNSPFVSLDDAKRMKHFVDVTKKKIKQHFGVEQ